MRTVDEFLGFADEYRPMQNKLEESQLKNYYIEGFRNGTLIPTQKFSDIIREHSANLDNDMKRVAGRVIRDLEQLEESIFNPAFDIRTQEGQQLAEHYFRIAILDHKTVLREEEELGKLNTSNNNRSIGDLAHQINRVYSELKGQLDKVANAKSGEGAAPETTNNESPPQEEAKPVQDDNGNGNGNQQSDTTGSDQGQEKPSAPANGNAAPTDPPKEKKGKGIMGAIGRGIGHVANAVNTVKNAPKNAVNKIKGAVNNQVQQAKDGYNSVKK